MAKNSMTRRERIMTALRCGVPDRPPVRLYGMGPWANAWADSSFGRLLDIAVERTDLFEGICVPGGPSYSACCDLNLRVTEAPSARPGYVTRTTVMPTPKGELFQVRCESKRHLMDPFLVEKYFIVTDEDADKFLSIPDDPFEFDASSLFAMETELGDAGIVEFGYNDPGYWVHWLMGSETMAIWSIEKRDLLHALYDKMQVRFEDMLKRVFKVAPGRVLWSGSAERWIPPLQSPRDFEEFEWASARRIADIVHENDGLFHYHCDGKVGRFLERFVAAGVDCLHPVEPPPMGDVTMAEAKARVGGRMCIEGGIEWGDVITSTPERIREMVHDVLAAGTPGGGYILDGGGPNWSPYLTDDLFEKWKAFLEAGLGE